MNTDTNSILIQNSPFPNNFWLVSRGTIGLLHVDPEKLDPTESSRLHFVTPTAIRLLLTDPPRFFVPPLLKCSITSQLDFLGNSVPVVVAKLAAMAVVIWLINCDWGWGCCEWLPHACSSNEVWAVRVCLRDAARRVNPIFLLLPSCIQDKHPKRWANKGCTGHVDRQRKRKRGEEFD